MMRKPGLPWTVAIASLLLGIAHGGTARGAGAPPSYQLQFLGSGSPTAINDVGTVVGVRINGSYYVPLVSTGGSQWTVLPAPADALSTLPTDINDHGVIVGVSYDAQMYPKAVRWTPTGGGYAVAFLPRLPGDTTSYATAINNLGQIVGARSALGYVPTGGGWLYSGDGTALADLQALYGWVVAPRDINDAGQVLGGAELLDLRTGTVTWIGNGPSNYNAVTGVAINSNGRIAGTAALRSTSLNIVSAFRYEPGTGWTFIAGSSRYTVASSINDGGDIGYGESGAGIYLAGLGVFAVNDLLSAATLQAGWAVTGNGGELNDDRAYATLGRNWSTGESGGVLLTPIGVQSPPTAPANLQGVAHPATRMEPFNSINLTWQNTSLLTRGYELQRSVAGSDNWTTLSLVPPGTATSHTDTTVGIGVTYDYRVRATGVGGNSPWSNVATVTAPSTPLDTTPPTVRIVTPAANATVSGTVTVQAEATDNVAVELFEISYWNQYTGQQVILGSRSGAGSLSASWATSGLTPDTYTLRAFAYDTLGNWSQAEIPVVVTSSSGNQMRVSSITLSARRSGSRVAVTGDVTVRTPSGSAVSGANVAVHWSVPGGASQSTAATTDGSGRARFQVSGSRGTYTLTVTSVTKAGYAFDAAGSVMSRSITR